MPLSRRICKSKSVSGAMFLSLPAGHRMVCPPLSVVSHAARHGRDHRTNYPTSDAGDSGTESMSPVRSLSPAKVSTSPEQPVLALLQRSKKTVVSKQGWQKKDPLRADHLPHTKRKNFFSFQEAWGESLVAPYRAILRYYRCDTPYRAILFKGV